MSVQPRSFLNVLRRTARVDLGGDATAASPLAGIGAGVALVGVAMIMKFAIAQRADIDVSYLPLFMVLPIAVIVAGPWAGVTVTLAGVLVDGILFAAPWGPGSRLEPSALTRYVLFIPIGLWLAALLAALVRLRREAAADAARMSEIIRALPGFVILADQTTGRILYISDAIEQLGWDSGALIGRPVEELLPDLAWDEGMGRERLATTSLVARDGAELSVEVGRVAVPLGRGEFADLLAARDLSEQIEHEIQLVRLAAAERRTARSLQAIIGSMDAGVALIGADGEVVLANDALTVLTEGPVTTRDELERRLRTALVPGEVQVPGTGRRLKLAVDDVDGSALVKVRDVTTEREAMEAQEVFVGVMSHELRTPVTTILGLAHLLGRPQGDADRAREFAAEIADEAERMGALIEDLLVLSRSRGNSVPFEPEPVLVQHAITAVIAAEAARHPHLTFAADIARDLPPVDGDRTFVTQVLRNIIGNAAKYSVGSRSTVSVTARVSGRAVEVVVRDEGPGFEPGEEDRLFEVFFRSERTAQARAGSGIGLYVSKVLVEAMHGRIWARLRPEGGAEFGFELPVVAIGDGDV